MGPQKIIVTGMKLETLKGRSDRPTTSRRLTEAMLVKAVELLAAGEQHSEEEIFADLLEGVGAAPPEEEEFTAEGMLLGILDGNIEEVTDAVQDLDEEDLNTLLKAEQDGKTRKGVVDVLEELLTE